MEDRRKTTERRSRKSPKGPRLSAGNDSGSSGNTRTEKHPSKAAELSRRDLCSGALAAAAAFTIVPRHVLGAGVHAPPSEKVNLAVIGTGCHGLRHVTSLLANQADVQVVAVCDVNREGRDYFDYKGGVAGREPARRMVENHYAQQKRSGTYKGCAAYRDFREMLEEEKGIEAVVVATPDHSHAVVAMQALKMGKHVYCEKPLTHTIDEARKLAEVAGAAKVATQMGNQFHAHDHLRLQVEVLRSGAIGPVHEVHAWCADTGWHGPWSPVRQRRWAAAGTAWAPGRDRPADTPSVPDGLDWDLWLGPAPYRPYHPAYLPFKWRGWWAFGSGSLGDMGCHIIDPVYWALELRHPTSVEATSSRVTSETAPVASMVHYEFPAGHGMPPVKLTWYDGGLKPPRPAELHDGQNLPGQGVLCIGEQGKLLAGFGGRLRLLPESRFRDFPRPEPSLPRVRIQTRGPDALSISLQHREWIDACKGGPTPLSNFDYADPLTETVLLGVIAIRTGKKLQWDSQAMKVTNVPDANRYVRADYREGWTL